MIKKAVIPSAGMGTRLLPATEVQPKEMLPIFVKNPDGELCLKPLLHIVFGNLYDVGFREFGFITGRGKRSVEDHFTVDNGFVELLKTENKLGLVKELEEFYRSVEGSHIAFINQPSPMGFGDAVHRAVNDRPQSRRGGAHARDAALRSDCPGVFRCPPWTAGDHAGAIVWLWGVLRGRAYHGGRDLDSRLSDLPPNRQAQPSADYGSRPA